MNAWSAIFLALSIAGVYSLAWQFSYQQRTKTMSQATDRLTASVQNCAAAVAALEARLPPPAAPVDETPIVAAADALDALTAKVDGIDPGTGPVPPPTT